MASNDGAVAAVGALTSARPAVASRRGVTRLFAALRTFVRLVVPARWRPTGLVTRAVIEATGLVVQRGPFAGMRYLAPNGHFIYPKVLGTYELELQPLIESILTRPGLTRYVVVGAAEGYYAAGLALRTKPARVVAFEANASVRERLESLVALNHLAIEIHGRCSPASLADELASPVGTFLLVDIDGGEVALLDPDEVPALREIPMLVEIHDFYVDRAGEILRKRFATTHAIIRIDAQPRVLADYPPIALPAPKLLRYWYEKLIHEGRRSPSYWLVFAPLADREP